MFATVLVVNSPLPIEVTDEKSQNTLRERLVHLQHFDGRFFSITDSDGQEFWLNPRQIVYVRFG